MNVSLKATAAVGLCVLTLSASALEISAKSEVRRFITYEAGDVYVSLVKNGEVCTWDYWLDTNSVGYDGILSTLIAAYYNKADITIYADSTKMWAGSGNPTCKIYSVEHNH
ncbi:hypothetical protein AAOGI_41450 [Agarivorans albus]